MDARERLIALYENQSKHSSYQVLPTGIAELVGKRVTANTRHEEERLDYIRAHVPIKDATVLDIGANTGYFSFELLDSGASHVTCYEGNPEHATFISTAAEALGVSERIQVVDAYYVFDESAPGAKAYTLTLLLNVLHHLGDDYGDKKLSRDEAKAMMTRQLNNMASQTDTLVFQLGFNWQGDPAKPLFDTGTKAEMIKLIKDGVKDYWNVEAIGIAEGTRDNVSYAELNDENIKRDDSLGEFLNRPIFILRSKK